MTINIRSRIILVELGFWFFLLYSGLPALSQSREWDTCNNFGLDPKTKAVYPARAIEACTAIIRSGRENRKSLALAYFQRGSAWFLNNRKIDQALADYDKAIKLNPYYAYAYRNRGSLLSATGGVQQPWVSLSPIRGNFYFAGVPTNAR